MKNKQMLKPIIGFGLVIDCIILDQITKWLVLDYLFRPELGEETLGLVEWFKNTDRLPFVSIEYLPFFNMTMVWNEGVSFGMFQSGNPWPLTIVALGISGLFGVWLTRTKSWMEAITLSMVIGGALGNVIDRFHYGAVADFFDFHIAGWHYPAFNLADSFITVGIVLLLIYSLFFQRESNEAH
jgi:signal peptidase II